jgi:hypothetical protein
MNAAPGYVAQSPLLSETGEMFVLRAGRKPEVLSKDDLGERFLASPAISGGTIFLRSDATLSRVRPPWLSVSASKRKHVRDYSPRSKSSTAFDTCCAVYGF